MSHSDSKIYEYGIKDGRILHLYMRTTVSFRPVEIWTSSTWTTEFSMDLPQGKWEQNTVLHPSRFPFSVLSIPFQRSISVRLQKGKISAAPRYDLFIITSICGSKYLCSWWYSSFGVGSFEEQAPSNSALIMLPSPWQKSYLILNNHTYLQ